MSVLHTVPPNITVVCVGYAGARQTPVCMPALTKMLRLLLRVFSKNECFTSYKFSTVKKTGNRFQESICKLFLKAKIRTLVCRFVTNVSYGSVLQRDSESEMVFKGGICKMWSELDVSGIEWKHSEELEYFLCLTLWIGDLVWPNQRGLQEEKPNWVLFSLCRVWLECVLPSFNQGGESSSSNKHDYPISLHFVSLFCFLLNQEKHISASWRTMGVTRQDVPELAG